MEGLQMEFEYYSRGWCDDNLSFMLGVYFAVHNFNFDSVAFLDNPQNIEIK